MKIDWSTTGSKIPAKALRASDSLAIPGRRKIRECRIEWERAEAGEAPFYVVTGSERE